MAKQKQPALPAVDPEQLKSVLKWILEANDERDIKQAIKTKYPKAKADDLLSAAVAEIEEIGGESGQFTRGWALAATRELVRKMIEIGDFANAMRGIKQVSDLAGK